VFECSGGGFYIEFACGPIIQSEGTKHLGIVKIWGSSSPAVRGQHNFEKMHLKQTSDHVLVNYVHQPYLSGLCAPGQDTPLPANVGLIAHPESGFYS